MARVTHVKKARKDNPVVKKGESYFHWSFRFGGKHYSKTYPKRSQLTQSGFLSQMYSIEDDSIADFCSTTSVDALQEEVDNVAQQIRDLGEECEENRNNMPEGLQDGLTGELLQTRYDDCEAMADELEAIDLDDYDGVEVKNAENPPHEFTEWLDGKVEELQSVSYAGE